MIKAAEANVAAVSNKTIVIPGHHMPGRASPVSNKTERASFHDMLVAIRTNVAKLKQQGRSLGLRGCLILSLVPALPSSSSAGRSTKAC
jgi:hypothetical protein